MFESGTEAGFGYRTRYDGNLGGCFQSLSLRE